LQPRYRLRIIHAGPDARCVELGHNLVAPLSQRWCQHGNQTVVAAPGFATLRVEHAHMGNSDEPLAKRSKILGATLQILFETPKLRAAQRGLHLAHPVVQAQGWYIAHPGDRPLAVNAIHPERTQLTDGFDHLAVPADEHPTFTRGDVLDRIKGEATGVAEQP